MREVEGYDSVALDLAFWDGTQLVGVLFAGESSRLPAARTDLARLQELMGERPVLRWIVAPAEEAALSEKMLESMASTLPPWFGPYRAEGFGERLPA